MPVAVEIVRLPRDNSFSLDLGVKNPSAVISLFDVI